MERNLELQKLQGKLYDSRQRLATLYEGASSFEESCVKKQHSINILQVLEDMSKINKKVKSVLTANENLQQMQESLKLRRVCLEHAIELAKCEAMTKQVTLQQQEDNQDAAYDENY